MIYSVILTNAENLSGMFEPDASFIRLNNVAQSMAIEIARLALASGYYAVIVPEISEE